MTDNERNADVSKTLTEQWKKGELPEGWYYVKDIHNEERLDRYFKETDNFEYLEDWEVDEVLDEVPSYEQWQAKLEENKQTKELLRKAKGIITAYRISGNQSTYSNDDMKECVAQIDQVLGEE